MTGRPDGQTLEQIIGELQTIWGVPESPQEYRLMIKVAEEREERGQPTATVEATIEDPPDESSIDPLSPRREKAPAAPRIAGEVPRTSRSSQDKPAASKRKRTRRGRGGRGRGRRPGEGG